jgi:DNA-directed RNA polymerase subunit M/transcription elongation factor TFIIS
MSAGTPAFRGEQSTMATTILIVCPECAKQMKAPENIVGKKIRCKSCQAAFVARKATGKAPPKQAAKPVKPATKPSKYEEDDDDPNPYGLIDVDLSKRCPDCANEMEEEAVICLTCGYNTQTREKARTRKIYHLTAGEHFFWLLPGIACALAVFSLIGFNIWYLLKIDDIVSWENDSFFLGMWTISGIKLWVVIMSLFLLWLAGKFAVKRLILHPKPPEVEKLK